MAKPTFLGPLIGKGVGQCELVNAERGSVLAGHVEPAFDSPSRKKGLLGRTEIPDDYAMVIAPCSAIHTIGMRVPIDVMFVARDGTVLKTCPSLHPWRLAGALRAHAVIEAAPGFLERHQIVPGESVAVREIPLKRRATDALPPPGVGPHQAEGAAPWRSTSTSHRVTLADVVARKTPLEWFESVAVVQELCESVLARGPADDLRVPELKHIALGADGRVVLLANGPSGHSPVQRAGLVLLALTPEEKLPLQLRLLILEEVSPRPKLRSLAELHRELEFFERPDRRVIVQELFERFHRPQATAPEAAVPPPLLEPPPPKRQVRWWKRRSVWTGTFLVLVTIAAAAAVWAWPRPQGRWLRATVARVGSVSLDAGKRAATAVRREVEAGKWKLGLRPRSPEPSALVLADNPPARLSGAGQNITVEAPAPVPAVPPVSLPQAPLAAAPASSPGPASPAAAVGIAVQGAAGTIFSAVDAQVSPPTLMSPRRSTAPAQGTSSQRASELELLISPTGEVETVRVLSGPSTALSGMQISAIKAWRFRPATRGGEPVRYRLRVTIPSM